jgi:HSP20 family protein
MTRDPSDWMWQKATDLLEQADRLHSRLSTARRGRPVWEPPADIFESETTLTIVVALPGVEPDAVQVLLDRGSLVVQGERRLPQRCRAGGEVRRLEIPYGRFERHLPLPPGRFELVRNEIVHGCLFLELAKLF